MTAEAFAPAKINLTLHVTGQRADGYHLLDSLVAFAEVGDRLCLTPGPDLSLSITGEFSDGVPSDHCNLVWQAAEAAGWTGRIHLEKQLPHGGGVGGGSSDAAAILRLLMQQGIGIPPHVPLSLGADVPVCVRPASARMRGIGEQIEAIALPKLPALLVNPGIAVPTGAVFAALKTREHPPMPDRIPEFKTPKTCAGWLRDQRNDLEDPACSVAGAIAGVLDELSETRDVLLARMSGSGSTCFALYPTAKAAHFAAYEIGAAHPEWWCRATLLS
ncbi:4-diphosphocytidyl-2-C-methyl-D-erythritol kinase [Ruegeria halocynthiae]|uniref:4-diphosphocytidyl-2-C-methyl-D-erythritol kinase n=1 Tax=Ruegeria halocynthiae TaxID=985054 RepID=A0A1H2ZBY0_9RHOB|nr:4-(cytidine 5'-diphospho)-2-C-methyl-D-erythritol kinase [Ruegeria halocynthiae]SDX14992.1 4-diphosphocytidyl-2-C-methyl-D-erythritol kinase [Ruegeria halocynthiae]